MADRLGDGDPEPSRLEIERFPGPLLLEFGARWCGHCRALAPELVALLHEFPAVRHVIIEDGPGRPLGRSFQVKLWPTLIFLRDGIVLRRLVRPEAAEVRQALVAIAPDQ